MSLADIQSGDACKVVKINAKDKLRYKLLDMGFVQGAKIDVIREAPLYDPMELRVQNYLIALRKEEARAIQVQMI